MVFIFTLEYFNRTLLKCDERQEYNDKKWLLFITNITFICTGYIFELWHKWGIFSVISFWFASFTSLLSCSYLFVRCFSCIFFMCFFSFVRILFLIFSSFLVLLFIVFLPHSCFLVCIFLVLFFSFGVTSPKFLCNFFLFVYFSHLLFSFFIVVSHVTHRWRYY